MLVVTGVAQNTEVEELSRSYTAEHGQKQNKQQAEGCGET